MHTALRRVVQVMLPDTPWEDLPDPAALDWSQIRYQDAAAIRARLAEHCSSASAANQSVVALRGVLKEAWRLGLIDAETLARATDIQTIREERFPSGRALSAGEVRALFKVCAADEGPAGVRDAALLAVLYGCIRCNKLLPLGTPVGAFVFETTDETERPGVHTTVWEQLTDLDMATGAYRLCDDDSPWPPGEEPA